MSSMTAKERQLVIGIQKGLLEDLWRHSEHSPAHMAWISRTMTGMRNSLAAPDVFASSPATPPSWVPQQSASEPVQLQDLAEPAVRPKAGRPRSQRLRSSGEPKKRGRPKKENNIPIIESPTRGRLLQRLQARMRSAGRDEAQEGECDSSVIDDIDRL
jgi:hypothetical protein